MKLTYPAIFYPSEDGGYTISVPDLPGCTSEGNTLAEAVEMATDAAGWVLDELEDGHTIPAANSMQDITPDQPGFTSLLVLDMDTYTEKYGDKTVRKDLTVPAWLNTFAE